MKAPAAQLDYEPISVALKFGFLAVLFLFLLWIATSGEDLKRNSGGNFESDTTIDDARRLLRRLAGRGPRRRTRSGDPL